MKRAARELVESATVPMSVDASQLPAAWRARAEQLERFAPAAAVAFRDAALELELAQRAADDEELTLAEAADRSGLSVDRLRHKIAAGEIQNRGRKHVPRIRAGDLPVKRGAARRGLSLASPGAYDPDADARALTSGGRA